MGTVFVRLGHFVAVLGIVGIAQVYNAPASHAAPNPDSCFTTTGTTSRTITNYNAAGVGCGPTVEIPSTIAGGTVVNIAGFGFYNKSLTSVIIPNTVITIGNNAFSDNQLTSVTLPNSVVNVGDAIFSNNLLTSVTLPSGLTSISNSMFATNAITSITIPNSVTSIGSGAFSGSDLTSLTIPNSVTTIGSFAFFANQLTSISLSSSLTSIGMLAFSGNYLTSITLPNSLTTIGSDAFSKNRITSVTIPNSVTNIGVGAFSMQSPHGSPIWDVLYDMDPQVAQAAADNIWYVRLYTADPSNPQGFLDDISFETTELDGQDNDWDEVFSKGGHLVNPTNAKLQFVNAANNQLLAPITLTGQSDVGNEYYGNYTIGSGPTVPFPVDPYSPTPQELQAARDALSQYYRPGDALSYTAEAIDGVVPTPASYGFVLGADTMSNERQFVYAATASSPLTSPAGRLAETGTNVWLLALVAASLVAGSVGLLAKKISDYR